MAWIGIRTSVSKIMGASSSSRAILQINGNSFFIRAAGISSTTIRDKSKPRPPPYPYKTKKYSFLHAWLLDTTTHRFDENTKVIVVDGPIAAGKTDFAKSLAEDLDMMHFPEPTMDDYYINSYGYDMRQLDSKLPPSARSFDEKNFCKEPNHMNVANFQIMKYQLRYQQYVNGLVHLLNTGQGVVLERSAHSDFVFLEAMFKNGYISKGARSVYFDIQRNTLGELMRPHLVIYLDVPVSVVKQRIKERKIPHEVKSDVFSTQYLSDMEYFYKQRYLNEISKHAELLIYDWSNYGDVEVVVEDIERIDFDRFDKYDVKMEDWRKIDEWDWNTTRMLFTSNQNHLRGLFNVPRFDVPELVLEGGDADTFCRAWYNAPGMKYDKGFNADMGDTDLLLKTSKQNVNEVQ